MQELKITPVILCGGSGTRLWPVSRRDLPKQFAPIGGGKSLLRKTLERVAPLGSGVLCVASENHRFFVAEALGDEGLTGDIVLEPEGRNTAAAMALAALLVSQEENDALLLFCPADHHVPDTQGFISAVRSGVRAAQEGSIVTFGVLPGHPSTAYGYIQQGQARDDGSFEVLRFVEKPDVHAAQNLLLAGAHLWNAGIFLIRASHLLAALEQHAPDILHSCDLAMQKGNTEAIPNGEGSRFVRPNSADFLTCRSQSIDYAVMERHASVAVIPLNIQWSDVGSWKAVADLTPADESGNQVLGRGHALSCKGTYIHAPERTVVALGTRDLLIIDTPDALLVVAKDSTEGVKDVVAHLRRAGCEEATSHRKVARPWGWYDSIDQGDRFQVKRIGVKPGASLSLQKHHHRAEHWVVVKGTALVTRGKDTFLVSENESTFIRLGEIHRLHNPGKVELEMIEIQSGSYLGEDDIVRFDDAYGRSTAHLHEEAPTD